MVCFSPEIYIYVCVCVCVCMCVLMCMSVCIHTPKTNKIEKPLISSEWNLCLIENSVYHCKYIQCDMKLPTVPILKYFNNARGKLSKIGELLLRQVNFSDTPIPLFCIYDCTLYLCAMGVWPVELWSAACSRWAFECLLYLYLVQGANLRL